MRKHNKKYAVNAPKHLQLAFNFFVLNLEISYLLSFRNKVRKYNFVGDTIHLL
jgi:hypothetical protein